MKAHKKSLFGHSNFKKLWVAQILSLVGTQVTVVALPIIAIKLLNASTLQVGLLTAMSYLPFLLFGLPAGAWVDRLSIKRLMIVCDMCRGAILILVPILYSMDFLTIPLLFIIAFCNGIFTVFFDISNQSFLPEILPKEQLTEGNSKLGTSYTTSQMVGPTIAGFMIKIFSAPIAILIDSISYFLSGIFIYNIKIPKQKTVLNKKKPGIFSEIREGLRFVVKNKYLKPIAISMSIANMFDLFGMIQAILPIYILSTLKLSPFEYGIILSMGNIGAILGTFINKIIVNKFYLGKVLAISSILPGISLLILPFVQGEYAMYIIGLSLSLAGLNIAVFNINQISLRQAITPLNLMGRMNATIRFIIWGTVPLGAFLGGLLGEQIGVRNTLLVAAIGSVLSSIPILFSKNTSLKSLKEIYTH
ncbi:MFS transporter [Aquimarina algiphila]|uniref:MFS transporter n=1 Tax=Aquimarina algiphila TaxID=2047982 RepID=UPI00232C3DB1|nr:MFS transporter [Aquimarina algiphila]